MNKYKKNWNIADFETMGWHDSKIYSINFDMDNHKLLFDIDYIFEWNQNDKAENYTFLISPASLIFNNVWNLKIDIEPYQNIEILNISRDNPNKPKNAEFIGKDIEWDWTIETICGNITLKSVGFEQIIREEPIISNTQSLNMNIRKEIRKHYQI